MQDRVQPDVSRLHRESEGVSRQARISNGQRESLDGWDNALKFAEVALEKSQDAEVLRRGNSIVDADATTETAFRTLKLRYNCGQILFSLQAKLSTVQIRYRLPRNTSIHL